MTTLYVLPTADTHCFDEDTGKDCWSFSRDLLLQEIAKAELRGRESMQKECVEVCSLESVVLATRDMTRGALQCINIIKELK